MSLVDAFAEAVVPRAVAGIVAHKDEIRAEVFILLRPLFAHFWAKIEAKLPAIVKAEVDAALVATPLPVTPSTPTSA